MKTTTYGCDNKGCKFQTQDKKMMITMIHYIDTGKTSRKGARKSAKIEEHYCSEDCLKIAKGYKELVVQK
jgi:hypothetical protein